MAKQQVNVPDIGGAEGAEVIELLVAVGDTVEVEQSLIVLESDKASMEIPSSHAGTVVELLVSVGDELAEGSAILVLDSEGDDDGDSEAAESSGDDSGAEPEPAGDSEEDTEEAEPEAAGEEPAAATSETREIVVSVPDIGTDDAVDLIEISVAVGDTVAEGDSLVVLESDKASMEVPSTDAGEVLEILVKEGDSVRQGDDLVKLKASGNAAKAEPADKPAPEKGAEPAATAPADKTPAKPAPTPATAAADKGGDSKGGPVYAGPAVRKLARELGVELARVSGTGPRDRILKEDVQEFVKSALSGSTGATSGAGIPPVPEVDFSAFGEVEHVARSKMDKVTAANMQRNWLNVPHVTQFDEADITDLEAFRKELKGEAEKRGTRLTPMPFLLKACAVALRDNPKFNASLSADGESLVYKKYIHIGMAVDTPAGLLVPVIRDVDKKSLWELAEEVLEMAGKARDRKLKPADMQGGCFTISSLGGIGGTGFTPIVNAPEVGILGVSRAEIKPRWNGSEFVPRNMMPVGLSYDHRVINGGDAGRFCTQLMDLLGDIRRLLF
ncbi:dihydrolipoyllysine-residue acetyltransferase [Parahaliea aestuarii]|uniref:Acetyltransferase component of pyruvate dehydrogenase complex n=1 Tax=Parahaliea aestuarii TaxID=1852021 RepID=A0A5C8ZQT5_9GAMM|nr:dihydrolipoyllysine-residue acetyltransferase [Parahaliea aestuarii]TXS90099.1 dihydrolipoyllysine-residue acetyltransferase [Parahaliea aestuarii]